MNLYWLTKRRLDKILFAQRETILDSSKNLSLEIDKDGGFQQMDDRAASYEEKNRIMERFPIVVGYSHRSRKNGL